MKTQTKLWAVVPAAGSGSRFSKTELKQYQYIQEHTVLEHTVNRLNSLDLAGCVLAIGAQDNFAKTLAFQHSDKLHFCLGGEERVHSVLNALIYLSEIAHADDWVLVHDAARPCVTVNCLTNLVESAQYSNQSAILAIPVRDTLKRVPQQHQIEKTVSRELLWQAQTPQMAKLGVLKGAIEKALANHIVITDEASALEYVDEPVQVVQGRSDNIKITYTDDLELARLILQAQD
ncbi:2-C-methyl-D-erythritol 4-phosphate cytidylyltransferase [Acinetobacter gyllenbergii]|uniref:2-C-methyl-D-erythritol 4-phosphate cytidylyltransferase n=1 Tax=Acinetobacter gyllenbergii CIP 110306 = MTCC 11365 TaxID=1217657 RepID=A0A829HIW7_9GAMM|nr:2-C-methyl-D-erythritol 4-phosphate cytidylyltransferase [Acinetobacter gyllenbergii]EPF83579.1 2-C-methyl-D-erythritol 4-phosphate cytidylyltransferase [Acinetobacter gyllenbergii CIP 110306 = MTCC 11365]EPH35656.1 2-C-methyl-D-erythritol 4-phosphate cytidylyltransferase [Acinetobacter gyllenbergii CIP 110306 = MTCC 11365]GMA12221.1 2-C-methyl-D-erythritol 4-phosphate cytidylyltransferase [Acinetobacter gyllenbergii]